MTGEDIELSHSWRMESWCRCTVSRHHPQLSLWHFLHTLQPMVSRYCNALILLILCCFMGAFPHEGVAMRISFKSLRCHTFWSFFSNYSSVLSPVNGYWPTLVETAISQALSTTLSRLSIVIRFPKNPRWYHFHNCDCWQLRTIESPSVYGSNLLTYLSDASLFQKAPN